jgi:hypothetical protein
MQGFYRFSSFFSAAIEGSPLCILQYHDLILAASFLLRNTALVAQNCIKIYDSSKCYKLSYPEEPCTYHKLCHCGVCLHWVGTMPYVQLLLLLSRGSRI